MSAEQTTYFTSVLPYSTVHLERLHVLLDAPNQPRLARLWKQLAMAQVNIRARLLGLSGCLTTSLKRRSSASLIHLTAGCAAVKLGIARCISSDLPVPARAAYYLALLDDGVEAKTPNPLRRAVRAMYWELTGPKAALEIRRRGARHLGFWVCRLRVFSDPTLESLEKDAETAKALEAIRKSVFRKVPPGRRTQLYTLEHTGRTRGRDVIERAIDVQIIETITARWGSVNTIDLLRVGLDGNLDIVATAIANDLTQRVNGDVTRNLPIANEADSDEHVLQSVKDLLSRDLSPERRAAWSEFWGRLTPTLQETARACLEGLTQNEMAIRFGITERAVRYRLQRLARLARP